MIRPKKFSGEGTEDDIGGHTKPEARQSGDRLWRRQWLRMIRARKYPAFARKRKPRTLRIAPTEVAVAT